MNTHWTDRFKQPDFEFSDGRLVRVPPAEHSTFFVPLSHYSIISVTGPDAHSFLQGQLTCDMDEVDQTGVRLGAHCNIKGHMHSLYQVMRAGEHSYWLRVRSDMAESALALLRKYIIFSKAEARLEEDILGLGLHGPEATASGDTLSSRLGMEPLLVVPAAGARCECWFDHRLLPQVLELLGDHTSPAEWNSWELLEIDAGIPELAPATAEAFIPQMTNLQALGGVSFTKGCYTGQEIVTRLQHRGQLKKPMYRAEIKGKTLPEPGAPLASGEKENVGQVVRAARITGGYRLLAVISKEQADTRPLFLHSTSGPQLTLMSLPYELDPELFQRKH